MTNIGLLGAGMIANIHAEAIVETGSKIISVYDTQKKRQEEFSQKWKCDCCDLDELLSRSDIEAVVVATPNDRHAELAMAAMRFGKDVLLEKPMAMSTSQCDEITQVQNETERVLQLGFVCRFAPASIKVKRLIDEGKLGTIRHARATLLRQRGIPGLGGWFTTKERSGGGCLIDIGVHLIDLLSHLTSASEPTRVLGNCTQTFSMSSYGYDEMWSTPKPDGVFDVEDGTQATISFANEITNQIDVSWATHLPESYIRDGITIEGDKGAVWFDIWGDHIAFGESVDGKPLETKIEVEVNEAWSDAFQGEHLAFSEGIVNRAVSSEVCTGAEGRKVQTIIEAIYKSNEMQREVCLLDGRE
ncbi:Gfo/Idh/MocA family oxidoreductase [PVC group bacterium]|nr:Gfo/Idh/MocA family oxidoreductase [PVC group bacterium]